MLTRRKLFAVIGILALFAGALATLTFRTDRAPHPQADVALTGQVTSVAEGSMEGVVVTARREGSTIAVSVISDAQGRYQFPAGRLEAGRHTLTIRAVGYDLESPNAADVGASGMATVDLALGPTQDLEAQLTNAEWLESIPGTEAQKRMFESCVRCHTIDRVMRSGYDADAWLAVLERMDGYVTSAFPGNPQRRPADQVTPFAERSERQQESRRRQAEYLASINLSSGKRETNSGPSPVLRAGPHKSSSRSMIFRTHRQLRTTRRSVQPAWSGTSTSGNSTWEGSTQRPAKSRSTKFPRRGLATRPASWP